MTRSGADLPKRVKFGWARFPEQAVPRVGANSDHAGQAGFEVAKLHGANQSSDVRAKRSHRRAIFQTRIYHHDKEDRGAGERRRYRLCNDHSVDLRAVYPNWPLRESTAVAVDYLHFKKAAARA